MLDPWRVERPNAHTSSHLPRLPEPWNPQGSSGDGAQVSSRDLAAKLRMGGKKSPFSIRLTFITYTFILSAFQITFRGEGWIDGPISIFGMLHFTMHFDAVAKPRITLHKNQELREVQCRAVL